MGNSVADGGEQAHSVGDIHGRHLAGRLIRPSLLLHLQPDWLETDRFGPRTVRRAMIGSGVTRNKFTPNPEVGIGM